MKVTSVSKVASKRKASVTARRTQGERTAQTRAVGRRGAPPVGGRKLRRGRRRADRPRGMTRGALYHQFADKADLFAAVLDEAEAEIAQRVAGSVAGFDLDTAGMFAGDVFLDASSEQISSASSCSTIPGPRVDRWRRPASGTPSSQRRPPPGRHRPAGSMLAQPVRAGPTSSSARSTRPRSTSPRPRIRGSLADMDLVRLTTSLHRAALSPGALYHSGAEPARSLRRRPELALWPGGRGGGRAPRRGRRTRAAPPGRGRSETAGTGTGGRSPPSIRPHRPMPSRESRRSRPPRRTELGDDERHRRLAGRGAERPEQSRLRALSRAAKVATTKALMARQHQQQRGRATTMVRTWS